MKKDAPKKAEIPKTEMEKLTANYEQFIIGKRTVGNGGKVFKNALNRAIKLKKK